MTGHVLQAARAPTSDIPSKARSVPIPGPAVRRGSTTGDFWLPRGPRFLSPQPNHNQDLRAGSRVPEPHHGYPNLRPV